MLPLSIIGLNGGGLDGMSDVGEMNGGPWRSDGGRLTREDGEERRWRGDFELRESSKALGMSGRLQPTVVTGSSGLPFAMLGVKGLGSGAYWKDFRRSSEN
jgi:hypothetical protein